MSKAGSSGTVRVLETPLNGEFEGRAVFLATHVTSARTDIAGSSRVRSKATTVARVPRTPSPFDPEADFNYESIAVSPVGFKNSREALAGSYCRMCQRLRVTPSSRFLKQIGSTALALREQKLSEKEYKAILTTLVNDTDLIQVDLSGNPTSAKEASYITELLKTNKFITQLTLSEMKLSGKAMECLAKTIKACIALKTVDLSSNFLSDHDCDSLCDIIEETDGIRELILHHNQLGECGVALGRAIADNITMTSLDLSWNHIRGRGAVGIARGLQRNQHLSTVNLSWNGFGFDGCVALAATLLQNTSLLVLNLTSNRIHLPALHKLLDGVVRNKTLTTLHLALNPIPAHCTSYMLHRIRKWKHGNLKELDLEGIVVDKDFEPMLEEIQQERLLLVRYDAALMSQRNMPSKVDPKNIFNIDPVRILFFMKQHLRTIDLFLKIDKDISGSLTKDEMRYAFQLEGYPISEQALDRVMGYLDTNNDGSIDIGEFFQGERRTKREMIREALEKRQLLNSGELTQDGLDSQASPDLDSTGARAMAKYSQAFIKPKTQTQPGKPTLGKKTSTMSPGMSPRSNTFV
ncbi:hypothetical protein RRG08_004115 [Elysia crispata]|uniref:EF-hand domain-containing protein n=1 Tax=Elysia crispata TaxID=231223 RepID=A0AAE1D6J9_9GAST|nr:hypothetical protein RRG08_004115 [Elysia crispata]